MTKQSLSTEERQAAVEFAARLEASTGVSVDGNPIADVMWVEWDCEGNTLSARYTDSAEAQARIAELEEDEFVSNVRLVR